MLDEKDPIETTEEFEHIVEGIDEDLDDDDSLDDEETEEIVSDITSEKKAFPLCAVTIAFYVVALLTLISPIYTIAQFLKQAKGQAITSEQWMSLFGFAVGTMLYTFAVLFGIGYIINLLKKRNK